MSYETAKARLEAATEGEWTLPHSKRSGRQRVFVTGEYGTYNICDSAGEMDKPNAEFIAHAKQDMEILLELAGVFKEWVHDGQPHHYSEMKEALEAFETLP